MALFLVQHGKSAAKEVDPQKGLSAEGRQETHKIAAVAKGYAIGVRKIVHSGKTRAMQTARIFHETLGISAPLQECAGLAPMDDVSVFAKAIALDECCMAVGHLPYMERLVSFLVMGDDECRVYRFQNSGIVCLDADRKDDGSNDWYIKWTLNPNIR